MAKVSEIMSTNVLTFPFSESITVAAKRMRDANIGVIVVTEVADPQQIYGLVTDRDLVVRGLAAGTDPNDTRLSQVCTRRLTTLSPFEEASQAEELMASKAIRRIPVVNDSRVVGVVSLGDLAIAKDRESALARITAAPPNT